VQQIFKSVEIVVGNLNTVWRTVRDKIACKTHLGGENYCFKHIFETLI